MKFENYTYQISTMDYGVNVLKFAEARATEIATLMHDVNSSDNKKKTWFQRLPHYMRRRGASQNPKRVPRKLREQNKNGKSGETNKKRKKPYRKKSAKDDSISKPTRYRQLETHLWHAKRFKMETFWDYCIPIQSTDKKLGTYHRAAANGCMIQDLSYYCCIELIGLQDGLIAQLSCLCDATSGHTFASKMFLDGAKEGHCFLYYPHSYPYKAIGPVTFLWEPDVSSCERVVKCRKLWTWCHPSFHDELVQVLIRIFALSSDTTEDASTPNLKKTNQREGYFSDSTNTNMNLLNGFARHRLIGPKSLYILSRVLQVADVSKSSSSIEKLCHENGQRTKKLKRSDALWWESYYINEEKNQAVHSKQRSLWNSLSVSESSHYITPRSVIGLTVRDPRCISNWTRKTHSASVHGETSTSLLDLDEHFTSEMAVSPLWNEDIRSEVTSTQLPEHLINEERSKCIVTPDLAEIENKVPVIIIHHPPLNGFGSRWDLIAPCGWSKAFWRFYERNGALAGGLRDLQFVNLEAGCPNFPLSFPDTAASQQAAKELQISSLCHLFRHPKSQRPNFSALAIPTPFFMNWGILIKDWDSELQNPASSLPVTENSGDRLEDLTNSLTENSSNGALNTDKESNGSLLSTDNKEFYVLRKMDGLLQLYNQTKKVSRKSESELEKLKASIEYFVNSALKSQVQFNKSLVLVKLKCFSKGVPHTHAGIYLLSDEDFVELKKCPRFSGPTEPSHSSKPESEVKSKHSKVSEYLKVPETLIECSTRKMIGYLSEGGFSSICGRGIGIGHCTSIGFLVMLKQCAERRHCPVVLWRNQHSFQYSVANIEPIENYL